MGIRKKFKNFLKENGAYDSFITELIKCHFNNPDLANLTSIIKWFFKVTEFKRTVDSDILIEAFEWSSTKNGHKYWSNLNINWKNRIEEEASNKRKIK